MTRVGHAEPQGSTSRGEKAQLGLGLDTGQHPGLIALPLFCPLQGSPTGH